MEKTGGYGFVMQLAPDPSRLRFTVGVVASAGLHAMVLALLLFGLPQMRLVPEQPHTIEIELIPPEEEEQAEKPAERKPPPEKPETAAQSKEKQEQTAPESEPAEKSAGEEKNADAAREETRPPPILRPVERFGETDTGPKKPADGKAIADAKSSGPAAPKPDLPEPPARQSQETTSDGEGAPVPEPAPPKPAESARAAPPSRQEESPVATTKIGDLPRGIRAGELCVSELRRQLIGAIPPYLPDLLPTYRLDEGNVLQVRKGAFRAGARWYHLLFRCEIDDAATRVVSFGFDVGAPIPRAEWASRGLPSQ